jgi:hypothetical protein
VHAAARVKLEDEPPYAVGVLGEDEAVSATFAIPAEQRCAPEDSDQRGQGDVQIAQHFQRYQKVRLLEYGESAAPGPTSDKGIRTSAHCVEQCRSPAGAHHRADGQQRGGGDYRRPLLSATQPQQPLHGATPSVSTGSLGVQSAGSAGSFAVERSLRPFVTRRFRDVIPTWLAGPSVGLAGRRRP